MFAWRNFRIPGSTKDERGAVLVYVALLLPVLTGTALLVIDGARLSNLQSFLQNGADALALAGAAELDRRPTAITRANSAMANLIQNNHKFSAVGPATVTIGNVRFLTGLPPSDANVISSSYETSDPTLARFVEVTVTPQTLNTIFPASFLGGSNTSNTGARAVAGFQAVVCKSLPMFICNPYEGTGSTIFDAVADPTLKRRQIKMQLGTGGSSQYFPGNYGWLDSPVFGNGADALRDALALVSPPTCFAQNGVSQKTGNIESANDALNVRFDLWRGPYNNAHKDSTYRPARNVRKGYALGKGGNGACNPNDNPSAPNPNTARLGRDAAFP
jgi:Flp pilus assembly protein TadG